MKVRLGFVSNSSTTSFCIIGYQIGAVDESERLEILKKLFPKKATYPDCEDDYEFYEYITEELGAEFKEDEIDFDSIYGDDAPYGCDGIIGVCLGGYDSIKQLELGEINEAFEIAQERLSKALDEEGNPEMYVTVSTD